ncbi:MAG: OadG family protein [Oscillospiraceae bacterium]
MGILESVGVAVFLMLVVFAVLLCLWGCIRLFSWAISKLEHLYGGQKNLQNNSGNNS